MGGLRWAVAALAAVAATVAGASGGRADEGVAASLAAHRIVRGEDGEERREPAGRAQPGDLLEYVVTCTNHTPGPVTDLRPLLPLPAGATYVGGSASPAEVEASTDGKAFAPAPLARRVRSPDGVEVEVPVPLAEYRFLRWSVGRLDPGQSVELRARVRVAGPPADTPRDR
jgi:uncharacterized repeat protein (TIGR01451 family)